MAGDDDGVEEELDAEGWKLKFFDLQVTYEELLESSHEYEQDLDNELKQYQLIEKQLREEVARGQHTASKHTAEEHSRKEQDSQRIRQLESELLSIKENERRFRSTIRSLEQDNETLEKSQRVLQAELEDQGERLQDAIEELEFLRSQLEDYASGVIVPAVTNDAAAAAAAPSPLPALIPATLASPRNNNVSPTAASTSTTSTSTSTSSTADIITPAINNTDHNQTENQTVFVISPLETTGEGESLPPDPFISPSPQTEPKPDYEALFKEETARTKTILMTLAATQSELFSLRSVVSGLTFRDGATMAIERGLGQKIDSWSRVRQAKEAAAAKEALERKGLERALSSRSGLGNERSSGISGLLSKNTNANSARGILLTRNNKLTDVWNPRYYVVDDNLHLLECYMMATRLSLQAGASSQRYGSVNLQGADIINYPDDLYGRPHCFGITPHFSKQTTQLQAATAQEKNFWLSTLRALTTTTFTNSQNIAAKEGYLDVEMQGVWTRCFLTLTANCIKVFEKPLDRTTLAILDLSDGGEVIDSNPKKLLPPFSPSSFDHANKKLTIIAETEEFPSVYVASNVSSPSSASPSSPSSSSSAASSSATNVIVFSVRNHHMQMKFRASTETDKHMWISVITNLLAPVGDGIASTPRQAPKSSGPVAVGVCFVNTRLIVYLEIDLISSVASLSEAIQNWMIHADQQRGRQYGPGTFLLEPPWALEQTACFYCRQEFTWRNRRHGCRNCGQSVCAACSVHTAVLFLGLGKAGEEPQRVCDMCHSILILSPPSKEIGLSPSFEPRIELLSLTWHGEKLQEHLQLMDYGITFQSLIRVSFPDQTGQPRAGPSHSRGQSSGRWKSLISASAYYKKVEPSVSLPAPHPLTNKLLEKKPRSQNDMYESPWNENNRTRSGTLSRLMSSPSRIGGTTPSVSMPTPTSSSASTSSTYPSMISSPPSSPSSSLSSSSEDAFSPLSTLSTLPALPTPHSIPPPAPPPRRRTSTFSSPPPPPPPRLSVSTNESVHSTTSSFPSSSSGLSLMDPLSPLLYAEETDRTGNVEQLLVSSAKSEWKPRTLVLSHNSNCIFYLSPALLKREATLKRTSRIDPRLGDKRGSVKPARAIFANAGHQTLGQILLENIMHVSVNDVKDGKEHVFTIHAANGRTWVYAAPSAQAQKDWISALQVYCKTRT